MKTAVILFNTASILVQNTMLKAITFKELLHVAFESQNRLETCFLLFLVLSYAGLMLTYRTVIVKRISMITYPLLILFISAIFYSGDLDKVGIMKLGMLYVAVFLILAFIALGVKRARRNNGKSTKK